jgi:hypothetical protein
VDISTLTTSCTGEVLDVGDRESDEPLSTARGVGI